MNASKIGLTIEEAAECTGTGRNTMRKLADRGNVLKQGTDFALPESIRSTSRSRY